MRESTYIVKFENVDQAQSQTLAADLQEIILNQSPDIDVKRIRDDQTTQDFGATLAIVLGAPAVVALVKGLTNWLTSHDSVSITIRKRNNGEAELIAENISRKDVDTLLQKFEKL